MFCVSKSVNIYNASDKSGVLVFVTELNKVVSLAPKVGLLLVEWLESGEVTKRAFMDRMSGSDGQDLQHVWDTLIFDKILIEER